MSNSTVSLDGRPVALRVDMDIETRIEILAPPGVVWSVLVDVERWSEWTASMTMLERLDRVAFGMGSRVRIRQPKLKPMVWRVSEFQEGRFFTWETQAIGFFSVARHAIEPSPHGSVVTLAVDLKGWLGSLLKPFFIGLTQRYVQMEAQGLKKICEELAAVNQTGRIEHSGHPNRSIGTTKLPS